MLPSERSLARVPRCFCALAFVQIRPFRAPAALISSDQGEEENETPPYSSAHRRAISPGPHGEGAAGVPDIEPETNLGLRQRTSRGVRGFLFAGHPPKMPLLYIVAA